MVITDPKQNGGNPAPNKELLVVERNGVAVITLNRPKKFNCLTVPMIENMVHQYKKWEEDDSTKMIILKGSGRVFCAGGDLHMFYDLGKSSTSLKLVVSGFLYFDNYNVNFEQWQLGGGVICSVCTDY